MRSDSARRSTTLQAGRAWPPRPRASGCRARRAAGGCGPRKNSVELEHAVRADLLGQVAYRRAAAPGRSPPTMTVTGWRLDHEVEGRRPANGSGGSSASATTDDAARRSSAAGPGQVRRPGLGGRGQPAASPAAPRRAPRRHRSGCPARPATPASRSPISRAYPQDGRCSVARPSSQEKSQPSTGTDAASATSSSNVGTLSRPARSRRAGAAAGAAGGCSTAASWVNSIAVTSSAGSTQNAVLASAAPVELARRSSASWPAPVLHDREAEPEADAGQRRLGEPSGRPARRGRGRRAGGCGSCSAGSGYRASARRRARRRAAASG